MDHCCCRDAEKAAEVARAKYDEAKAQRELAEQKTAEHKQIDADHLAMQQRLQDADAQLASMTEEMDHQAAALEQGHASRQQRAEQLEEAEEEVKRIMQQLAQAQAIVEQLKEEITSVAVSPFRSCTIKCSGFAMRSCPFSLSCMEMTHIKVLGKLHIGSVASNVVY